jgi:hypothetical protein
VRAPVRRDAGFDEFFLASVGPDDNLRQEVFFLAYHLHWSHGDILSLEWAERRAYLRLLVDQIERENKAVKEASRKAR